MRYIYYIDSVILIASALLPAVIGAMRYRWLDKGSKILYCWIILNCLVESAAFFAAVRWRNNLVVYNIGNIAELFIISLYFNYTLASFYRRKIGIIIGCACVVIGILNDSYIETWRSITHFFLLFEALTVIAMSLTAVTAYLRPSYTGRLTKEVHFWIPVSFLFFWTLSYLLFALLDFYSARLQTVAPELSVALPFVAIITNITIAVILFRYPKMYAHVRP